MAVSNITNNPYVQPVNQTILSNITSSATGTVNNITKNTQGALGSSGSIASSTATSLTAAGASSVSVGGLVAAGVDKLISGSSSFYTSGSPERITSNALQNRNFASQEQSNPEIKVNSNQLTTNDPDDHYPEDLGSSKYFMTLSFANYVRTNPLGNTTINPVYTVNLPLPDGSGLVDNTSARWAEAELGSLGNIYDSLTSTSPASAANIASDAAAVGALYAISQAGTMGAEASNLGQSAAGVAPNPSLSMMFTGINFRSFTFNWLFSPKTPSESVTLNNIIKTMKQLHLPSFTAGGSSLLFQYPCIVKPKINPSQTETYMTDFKWCVIKSINVNYSPQDVAPAFYAGINSPVFIALTMELEEMEYRLPTDYGASTNMGGTNADSALLGVLTGTLSSAVSSLAKGFTKGTSDATQVVTGLNGIGGQQNPGSGGNGQ